MKGYKIQLSFPQCATGTMVPLPPNNLDKDQEEDDETKEQSRSEHQGNWKHVSSKERQKSKEKEVSSQEPKDQGNSQH
jgi:hypothetical protein